jgi:hypothetical protein
LREREQIITMAFGAGRALTTPLAVINFILYLIAACLAGWALNKYIDGGGYGNGSLAELNQLLLQTPELLRYSVQI